MNTMAATFSPVEAGTRVALLVVRLEPSGPPHCMKRVSPVLHQDRLEKCHVGQTMLVWCCFA